MRSLLVPAMLAAVLLALPAVAQAQSDDQALVVADLEARGAREGSYTIEPLNQDYITRSFPGYSFFSVVFRQWPIAVLAPDDLAPSNVYVVTGGLVTPQTSPDQLEAFFMAALGAVGTDADAAKDAARSWLRMSVEFSQDMFFRFSDPVVDFAATTDFNYAFGSIYVLSGGEGQLNATLVFLVTGELADVAEERNIVAGIRPICQATKLLDRDPLVRRIAERDLLVLGRAAKDYLIEQRGKARSLELRRAIDRVWARIFD